MGSFNENISVCLTISLRTTGVLLVAFLMSSHQSYHAIWQSITTKLATTEEKTARYIHDVFTEKTYDHPEETLSNIQVSPRP